MNTWSTFCGYTYFGIILTFSAPKQYFTNNCILRSPIQMPVLSQQKNQVKDFCFFNLKTDNWPFILKKNRPLNNIRSKIDLNFHINLKSIFPKDSKSPNFSTNCQLRFLTVKNIEIFFWIIFPVRITNYSKRTVICNKNKKSPKSVDFSSIESF